MAWSTRACAPTRSPWSGRTISSPMAANIMTPTGSATFEQRAGRQRRSTQYATNIDKYGPVGAASFCFDEAFNVMAQGKAYSYITYNFFRAADRRSVEVAGGRQGRDHAGARSDAGKRRQPQRRLGLGNPEVEPESRRRLDFPQVGRVARRSPRSARWPAARRPAPTCSTIPRCNGEISAMSRR